MTSSSRRSGGRVTSSRIPAPPFTRTIRFRLSVWYSSLLLVFGLTFVVALNIAARLDQPDVGTVYRQVPIEGWELRPVRASGPGGAVTTYEPVVTTRVFLQETEEQWQSDYVTRLRNWSVLAVVGLAAASGVGGYVLSGMMLRPVRDITEVASEISATNLGRRINHQGPEDEMKALADTFDQMIGRLETSFEQQRQFVQDASHELRTPLTAIRTNIEVTEMDPDASAAEYRDLLDTIKTQTERLTRLTEDLLLLSRHEGEHVEPDAVDTNDLVREVASQLRPLAASRGVEIVVQTSAVPPALAVSDLLYRCVLNLVDNAIKYSGEGGRVTIRNAGLPGRVEIEVADTGPGIPPEDLPHVFDRFFRVDKGRSRREGGSGLGLAIVREVMASQGGTVRVTSATGTGTTFTLSVPPASLSSLKA